MRDLISRREAINSIRDDIDWLASCRSRDLTLKECKERAESILNALPDVKPGREKGTWIEYTKVIVPEPYNEWEQAWKCSECGFDDGFWAWKFCPNCGARMDDGKEY